MQTNFPFNQQELLEESLIWEQSESEKGQVYTRPEVVDYMLTAIGLKSKEDFKNARILEPSCGEGEFVIAIVKRLLGTYENRPPPKQISQKLVVIDLVRSSVDLAKKKVSKLLKLAKLAGHVGSVAAIKKP